MIISQENLPYQFKEDQYLFKSESKCTKGQSFIPLTFNQPIIANSSSLKDVNTTKQQYKNENEQIMCVVHLQSICLQYQLLRDDQKIPVFYCTNNHPNQFLCQVSVAMKMRQKFIQTKRIPTLAELDCPLCRQVGTIKPITKQMQYQLVQNSMKCEACSKYIGIYDFEQHIFEQQQFVKLVEAINKDDFNQSKQFLSGFSDLELFLSDLEEKLYQVHDEKMFKKLFELFVVKVNLVSSKIYKRYQQKIFIFTDNNIMELRKKLKSNKLDNEYTLIFEINQFKTFFAISFKQ